ncbi:MAG: ABC transporter substrate-binding protein [Erysipelotrichaceae bacterium]|nr:ABC transporter substrate-binding protein [Erysipelotrichaceae bacterium]
MKKIIKVLSVCLLMLTTLTSCLSNNYENGELYIFLPGEYISDEVIDQFEYEYGVKLYITTFDSNESMYTKLLGGTVYDIIIPSDYMIERLINEKMIQKLDKSKIPNLEYIDEAVLGMDFDPNNDYSVPYFWGNAGICFDTTLIDEEDVYNEGWEVLRNRKYKGMIYMYDSIRDAFMVAEKALGYSMNTDNVDELNEAYEWLADIAKNMDPAYVTDEILDGLIYGEKAMGMVYSGDAALILSENEDMGYYAPEEGTNYFVDAMVIHKDAKNLENAYKFINYISDYDAAFENAIFVGYCSANKEVLRDIVIDGNDFEDNDAYIPREQNENDEVFHNNEEVLKIISELWVKVKNTK